MSKPLSKMNLKELYAYRNQLLRKLQVNNDEETSLKLSEVEYEIRGHFTRSAYDESGEYYGPTEEQFDE